MARIRRLRWPCGVCLFCTVMVTMSLAQITTLANFSGANGDYPSTALIQGADGNFYGTTRWGGANNECEFGCGTIFKIASNGTLMTMYSFCTQSNCADGGIPLAPLVQAPNGDFYGTTSSFGTYGGGSVFKITLGGKLTTLYSFCVLANCADGAYPTGKLILAADGGFYGTTALGGISKGDCNVGPVTCGTIFKITPSGTLTTVYNFCALAGCVDGYAPSGGLTQAVNGKFYGVTVGGGNVNYLCGGSCGTVFEITPSGKLTTLHSFDISDGYDPAFGLIQASDGAFYGETSQGGSGHCGLSGFSVGCGTIFKITGSGTFTTLYSFCGCTDGAYPNGPLIQGTDGNLYGTTQTDGVGNAGTAFEITPGGALTTLYAFCGGSCGWSPEAGLLQATGGDFYGTTSGGGSGTQRDGTIFSLSTGLGPFVNLPRDFGKVGQAGGILGQGFTGTTGVFLNGTSANFTVVSDTFIRATVPPGATTGFITVDTPSGTLTSSVPFQVIP